MGTEVNVWTVVQLGEVVVAEKSKQFEGCLEIPGQALVTEKK